MRWLGVENGTLVELRTIEPETRAITRSIDKVVELASNLTMKNRFGKFEQFIPQGVYLYPNTLIPSMAATSEADLWLSGAVKIGSTKEKFEYRRFFYFDFDTIREGDVGVSSTSPELGRTMRGALDRLDELAAVVGADNLLYVMSGNGVQVWVKLANIPETPELEKLVHRILRYTSAAWTCADYKIDEGVFEANRLAPLAGTMKRKGANYCPVDLPKEQHRPHRMVRVIPVGSPTPVGITFEQLVQLSDFMKGKLTDADVKRLDAEIDKKHAAVMTRASGATSTSTTNGTSAKSTVEADAAIALPTLDVMSALGLVTGDGKPTCPKCGGTEDNSVERGGFKCFRTNNCTAPFFSNLKLVAVHEFHSDSLKNGVFKKSYDWLKEHFPQLPPLPPKEYRTPLDGPGMGVEDYTVNDPDVNVNTPAPVAATSTIPYHFTDTGNGLRLVNQFGAELRYCPESTMWLVWTGKYWAWDVGTLLVQEKMKEIVVGIHKEADAITDEEQREAMKGFAYKSEATRAIKAAIDNARSDNRIRINLSDLDKNDNLVNFHNGTFDLNTCELRSHNPRDLITVMLAHNFNEKAQAPKFRALLERAKPDLEERAFRIRRLGQYLSGRPDKSFIISWGPKDTAKSTFYQTVAKVYGPYATRVPRSVVEKSFHEQHPAHLMTMKGKRLAFGAEIRESIDIDRIKELTGESDIPARGMGENWTFIRRTFKLEVASNEKLKIDFSPDDGMATRTILDPWLVNIPKGEQIENYHDVLAAEEAEGILALMVEGWKQYKEMGLAPPKSILAATEQFLNEQGGLLDWIAERCDTSESDAETPTDDLYESFRTWHEETFHRKAPAKLTKQVFGMRLGKKYPSVQHDNVKVRCGIKLRVHTTPAPEYDLNDPCIITTGLITTDHFFDLEMEQLMKEVA